ncbi:MULTISPECIES: RHS repeat-associated core domain-containing protein [Stenotrophomonas]|uniref:RHS repeat-associated core domain-containing protein n=1 Tax=Stenotrophomonas sp. CFBP8994 TaxID=3096527 RepID=UPI002A69AEED|nr:RHS repeat-associated core domain-containing protein [Stenotrophomonas sp. CFBP8994]MDY0978989.1 RHS repeat-associated core domain-containing protein [Stenotrophomonas sp. CFBP8994]
MPSLPTTWPRAGHQGETRGWLGYNGQLHEPGAAWQFLGNGYRIYNPVLMRFHSPDESSPFGGGGVNVYAYCGGDPVNFSDPSGHFMAPIAALMGLGAVAMGVAAVSKVVSGDRKGAALFGAIAGGLLLGAGILAGGHALYSTRSAIPAVKIAQGRGLQGEIIIRRRYAHGGVGMSILGHGSPYRVKWGSTPLDGRQLAQHVKATGGGRAPVDYIELNACFGAAGGKAAMGQVIADDFGVPTFAYPERTFGGWGATGKLTAPHPPVAFQPQTGIKRAASAVRNSELHNRARGRSTQRQLRLI